jgi:S1-C subfamily serine protease
MTPKLFIKRLFWLGILVFLVAVVGGFSGIIADRALLPNIAASHFFSRWEIFKKVSENTVIINKTEQVVVSEDDSIETIALSASPSVVNILSVRNAGTEIGKVGEETPKNIGMLQGSGVLVTNDGVIATFKTALLEGATYTVFLYNGTSYPAKLVATDPLTGISFLSIAAKDLPSISFANPEDIRAGKKLLFIANTSEEYRNRYSMAILGNTDKTFNIAGGAVASSERWEGVYIVDAANIASYLGGPAIDSSGDLVGIVGNSPKNGGFESFLLPGSAIQESLDRYVRGTLESRPSLGVSYLSITKAYAIAHSIERDRGALITSPSGKQGLAILSGSPAEKAGLLIGDIIISVAGKEINLDNPLSVAIGRLEKGRGATIRILRAGKEKEVQIPL